MVALIFFLLNLGASPFKPKSRLEAENAALRQQLIVLKRKVGGRVQFTNSDRLFFIQLYRWCPSVLKAMMIIRPETVVRWHRAGFRRYWRWKSCSAGGRPQIHAELRALIWRMSVDNRLWGAPHIQGELLKLGFAVAQSTVAKYMATNGDPSGQSWGTFLRNHMPHIAAMDLFVVPSVSFKPALRSGDCPAGSARACLDQCDSAPDGRMDRAATYGSHPVCPHNLIHALRSQRTGQHWSGFRGCCLA
jgi:hypothetical protein